jgi:hypothetical protein
MWVILCLVLRCESFGSRAAFHKGPSAICIPRLLRIADKCLVADPDAFIAIYFNE